MPKQTKTKLVKHKCEYCGKEFEGNLGAKYCSASCRVLACKARKHPEKGLQGIGQVVKKDIQAEKTRTAARNIFKREISKHPEIIEQAQNMQPIGANYEFPTTPKDAIRELLLLGALAIGINALFNPSKGRKR